MSKLLRRRSWAGLLTSLLLAVQTGSASAASTGNLLRNGDAETHRCTDDWTAQTPVPGWTVLRGAASVLCYSAFVTAQEAPLLPASGEAGRALFAAPGPDTAIAQRVDLTPAQPGIDQGGVSYLLSGWLGGWRDRPEQARLTAIFRDAAGRSLGAPVLLGDAGPVARQGRTGLLALDRAGKVPVGARSVDVTLEFESGFTSYHNAYADALALVLQGDVDSLGTSAAAPPVADVPRLDHVVVVMMENTNYADVVHHDQRDVRIDARMPFVGELARRGVLLSNYWATYHPSDQNYVAMVAGDTYRYGSVYYPDYDLPVDHLGDQLEAAGLRWAAYVQHMNSPCNLLSDPAGQGYYAPDDQPFAQFADVISNPLRCRSHLRDLGDFQTAVASRKLPEFVWIAADGWWDGEGAWWDHTDIGASLLAQDAFLKSSLQPLLASPEWQHSRSLLVLTWDESLGWGWPDNRTATVLVGSPGLLREGTVDDTHYDGYSVLRTVEAGFALPGLDRFDRHAAPFNAPFSGSRVEPAALRERLAPAAGLASRGQPGDVFGQVATPAAVSAGQAITFQLGAGAPPGGSARLSRAGELPPADAAEWRIDDGELRIPSGSLAPGRYQVWLQDSTGDVLQAGRPLGVLAATAVDAAHPGVAVLGAPQPGQLLHIREASNLVVHYCRAIDTPAAASWIGVFPAGTAADQWTQANADTVGFALRAPGAGPELPCSEQAAFVAELSPGQPYQILLLALQPDGSSRQVGAAADIVLDPALP